jgi:hypothetical protein
MKQAMALFLLAISPMVGSLAAEVSTVNAAVSAPALCQVTPPLRSAASPLQVPETLPDPLNASSCLEYRTIINYWGFEGGSGNDSCPVLCGPCSCEVMTNKLVGQVIYECDGSITEWGLNCDESTVCEDTTITVRSCPYCGPEEY